MSRASSIIVLVSLAACAARPEPVTTPPPRTVAQSPVEPETPVAVVAEPTCERGDGISCDMLAERVRRGDPDDAAAARVALRRACTAAPLVACLRLAEASSMHDAASDRAHAETTLEHACDVTPSACVELALMLDGGALPVDAQRAFALLTRACEAGSALGCGGAADMLRDGRGVAIDEARARALYERACDAGAASECRALAGFVLVRATGDADTAYALSRLRMGCAMGDRPACARALALVDAGVAPTSTTAEIDATFAARCDRDEDDFACEAPSQLREGTPRAGCRLPIIPEPDPVAGASLLRVATRLLRGADIALASALEPRARGLLERALFRMTCGEGDDAKLRFVRPLKREPDGRVLALVEWFVFEGSAGGYLHESLVRIGPADVRVVDGDVSFFWHYMSMGISALARSTDRDVDGDGLRDVMMIVESGYDDARSEFVVVVSSRGARIDVERVGESEHFTSNGCVEIGDTGPTFWLAVESQSDGDGDFASSRSCLAALSFDVVTGAHAERVEARLGAVHEVRFDSDTNAHVPALRRALTTEARRTPLIGLPIASAAHGADEGEAETPAVDDEGAIRAVRPFPFPLCPVNPAFVLVSTPGYDDAAVTPLRARVAYDAAVATGTPDAPTFPETTREPFCNLFR